MRTRAGRIILSVAALAVLLAFCLGTPGGPEAQGKNKASAKSGDYRSPFLLASSPDGKTLYASDRTAGVVAFLDTASNSKRTEIMLHGEPTGLAVSADGGTLYVAEHGGGTVAVIDTAKSKVAGRIPVGQWPTALAIAEQSNRLFVCNQDNHTVSVIDLNSAPGKPIKQIPVIREPSAIAVTPDEKHVVVANLLAYGVGTNPALAAEVSILDTAKLTQSATVKLPPGSTILYGICVSPDGKWAYVVHGLGRFNLPITQLERGWVNTYALSLIDIAKGTRPVTFLLDDLTQGAADPFDVVCSKDGSRLWISHTGTHEISIVEIGLVHKLLAGKVPEELAALKDGTQPNIWVRIQKDPKVIAEFENDLTALYIAGAIRRAPSGGTGPRGLALSPDGKKLFVANYYSGTVAVLDAARGKLLAEISMGPQPKPDPVRRGEIIFHDATLSFQHWHSCASCHPNQGRIDGLRWDFLADGIGNPKDTITLVYFQETQPSNRRATLDGARDCAKNGLMSTNMLVPTEQDVDDLYAYLIALRPAPSPRLTTDDKFSEAAARGKAIFEGKASCAGCHPAPYFTDRKMHNVGVLSNHHQEKDGRYDTPSLFESYRTAPFLHDGRALTLKDVFTKHDKKGQHGKAKSLSPKELDDLVAYLLAI